MFLRVTIIFILFISATLCKAQTDDVCGAIMAITQDAPAKFKNIRGKVLQTNPGTTIWQSGIKVPGSIGSRFVMSMGLFYECAFFQSKNKADLEPVYEKYKILLNNCLLHEGYTLSLQPNFYPGIENYKKLVFMTDKVDPKSDGAPAHITMEATYSKTTGLYTLVMFIFEH